MNSSKVRKVKGNLEKRNFTNCLLSSVSTEGRLFSINEKFLAMSWKDKGEIVVLNSSCPFQIKLDQPRIKGPQSFIKDLEFSPFDNSILASSNEDNSVLLWKIPEEQITQNITKEFQIYKDHNDIVNFINFNPLVKDLICSCTLSGEIHLWNTKKGQNYKNKINTENRPTSVSWDPNGSLIGVCTNNIINIFDPRVDKIICAHKINEYCFSTKFVWADSNSIFTISSNKNEKGNLKFWDIRKMKNEYFIDENKSVQINSSKEIIFPFINRELKILYTIGKGDNYISIYDYSEGIINIKNFNLGEDIKFPILFNRKYLDNKKSEIDKFAIYNNNKIHYVSFRFNDDTFIPPKEYKSEKTKPLYNFIKKKKINKKEFNEKNKINISFDKKKIYIKIQKQNHKDSDSRAHCCSEKRNNNNKKKINSYEKIKKKNTIIEKYKKENIKLKEEIKEKNKIIENLKLQLEEKNKLEEEKNKVLIEKFKIRIQEEIEKINKYLFNQINQEINKLKEEYKKKENKNIEKLKELNEIIKKYNIDKNEEKSNKYICNTIHNGIKCEKCFQELIIGCRYKSSECNNYNLCEKCKEKNSISEEHVDNFIKIREEQKNDNKSIIKNKNYINNNYIINISSNNKDNDYIKEEEETKKIEYSYECMNISQLSTYIYEGENEAEIKIILKNNGNISWPKDKSKLIFDRDSQINGDEIRLESQKPGEQKSYRIIFKQLKNNIPGEYLSFIWFYVNENFYGQKLKLKAIIKEKEN